MNENAKLLWLLCEHLLVLSSCI